MSHQLPLPLSGAALLVGTAAYQDTPTSREAAERVRPKLGKLQREVLQWFALNEPATDNQLLLAWVASGRNPNTPRARRVDLTRAGMLELTGDETGGCRLWRVTPAGRVWLALEE